MKTKLNKITTKRFVIRKSLIGTNTIIQDNTIKEEALSALLALGFAKKDAESKIDKVLKSDKIFSILYPPIR